METNYYYYFALQAEEHPSVPEPDEAGDQEEPDLDLISFEEEAELVRSGSSTPEMVDTPPGAKSVVRVCVDIFGPTACVYCDLYSFRSWFLVCV